MRVVVEQPPLIDLIRATFPVEGHGTIYAWGDRIFNPENRPIGPTLMAHEQVHGARQGTDEAAIRQWWERYIVDPEFRLAEEIPAHRAEYQLACRFIKDRNKRVTALLTVAGKLAHPLYGSLISRAAAQKAIAA